ncbi:antibiotic biosynthesis monooxygenase family protein [Paraburkholderia caffeinitolerans]|uniref:antibiotic biosynthesis monooxygenase family protein n=1 Tax=Paraburkholderia caffeinitolerans TaxID=1723730 RepID=UPI0015829F2E|nr:antibiotic biosynthesis monooxygenase family protein [Paraburkholderia caffeinitolerans]
MDFDSGNYGRGRYRGLEIALSTGTSGRYEAEDMAAAGDPGDILVHAHLICKLRGGMSPGVDDCFLVTACRVASRDADRFMEQFGRAAAYMRNQAGFVRARLFENVDDEADLRFVNVAQWRCTDDFVAAFNAPEFKSIVAGGFEYSSEILVAHRIMIGN